MYIVRFLDKQHDVDSEYNYANYKDAIDHLDSFRNDDSNLYSNISILDAEHNLVLVILIFDKSGAVKAEFHDGSVVQIKKEWQEDPSEANDFYWITNINEERESCLANYVDMDHKYAFGSSHTFSLEWLDVVKL